MSQCGAIFSTFQPLILAALFQSVRGLSSPQLASNPFAFRNQFLKSIPITLGFPLYLSANFQAHSKKEHSGYQQDHHKPSPSSFEQHHCDLLVWLFKMTINPTSVSVYTVISNICIAVLPINSGFALRYIGGISLLSKQSWSEQVRRMQFILNLQRISMAISRKGRHSSPSTQWRHMCPPDQLPPANLTLLPVSSTIMIPLVESGNLISQTLKRGLCFFNSFTQLLCPSINILSPVISTLPIPWIQFYYLIDLMLISSTLSQFRQCLQCSKIINKKNNHIEYITLV